MHYAHGAPGLLCDDPAVAAQLDEPRPRDMSSVQAAFSMGLIKRVPKTPPTLLPGPTVAAVSRSAVLRMVPAFFGAVVIVLLVPMPIWIAAPLGLVVLGYVFLLPVKTRNRQLEELAEGYTTLPRFEGGGLEWHRLPVWRRHPDTTWLFAGVWVLDSQGRVVSAPDPSYDPPGFYPSPNKPDRLQFWTGRMWLKDSHRKAKGPWAQLLG